MLQYFSQERAFQHNTYTPQDFLFRWKKLERVLAKESIHALLLATGLDAKDSVYSAYLFNWLFLGLSGKEITINKYLDTIYSQIIVIISSKGSSMFITPEAKESLETLIYTIPNCKIFCPTQKQYDNKELLDTLKIATFYGMTLNVNKIGVFLGENQDIKLIQKWPLIQSYALQPVGKTFFTLKHQAVNLYSKITPLFRNLDKHSLKNLVNRTAYSMEGHVKGSLMQIQLKQQEDRKKISELFIQESLQETVDIELFESGSSEYKGLVRILFGDHTKNGDKSSPQAKIQSTHANHLTVEHYDPYTKMKIWRTYFLNIGLKQDFEVVQQSREQEDSFLKRNFYKLEQKMNQNFSDTTCLINLYVSLVQATLQSISAVSKDYRNLNNQFITKSILDKINQKTHDLYGSSLVKQEDLITEIESFDSFGEPRTIDFKDSISFKLTSTFYVLKIRLKNVTNPQNKKNLGSLLFSESFLLQQGCYLLLTKNTPYFDFWNCGDHNSLLGNLNPNIEFEELGKPLSTEGFRNRIFIPCQKLASSHFNIPILDVKYYFHENGMRIYSNKIGWKIIFYKDMQEVTMVNKISGEWVLMKIKQAFLFEGLESNIIGIQFRGKPFDFLMNLTKAKNNPLEISYIDSIPQLLSQNWEFTTKILKKPIKEGQPIYQHQIFVNDFLWSFIESKQMMIINQMKDMKMAAFKTIYQMKVEKKKEKVDSIENKHSLVLVVGTYGAGKLKLAQNLRRFGPNQIKTDIFSVSPENLYDKLSEQTYTEMLEQFINDNSLSQESIIITIVPSWVSFQKLLPKLSQKYHIRSVLTKVNASNFFANKNFDLVENVLSYCLPGYTQNIVIDSFSEEQNIVNSVIKIVGTFNKEAKVARSSNCLLTTGQCLDILNDSSFCGEYESFLRMKYGVLFNFDELADLTLHYIEFKPPLYDMSLVKILTKSEGYLIDRKAVLKEIEHKKKQAENSKDQLMMSLYFLEQVMTIVRKRQKIPQIRSIKGFCQARKPESKEQKGYFEVNWANSEYRVIQIDAKKDRTFGFSVLCRRFDEAEVRNFIENLSYRKHLFGEFKQMRTVDSLTKEQLENIEKDAIVNQKYFENGEYFDGYVLRNNQGFAIDNHPYMNKVIEGWIGQWNESVVKENAELRAKWNQYVDSYKSQ